MASFRKPRRTWFAFTIAGANQHSVKHSATNRPSVRPFSALPGAMLEFR
jgi:hypothetical protein